MKLQKIISRLQKLHPKEIDLSLGRIINLCRKLKNPQDKIKAISIVGTNGKYSTIQAMYAILKQANYNCNVYTSPHIQNMNERFIFNNKEIKDDELVELFEKVEKVNNNQPITFFEILTAAYFYKASQYPNNINLIEAGLFHRFDATNILKKNLASIITSIGLDHLDWLPKNERTIKKIIFEKTSNLPISNIIIAKQISEEISNEIKSTILKNKSKKLFYKDNYCFSVNKNGSFNYKDKIGVIKQLKPNLKGQFQIENISTAISALRQIKNLEIKDYDIKTGITKIRSLARLQEITKGKLKKLIKKNRLLVDGSHNPLGAQALNKYLASLKCNKHIILGMMANKNHLEYFKKFENISSVITIDIPNQPNSIKGQELKKKLNNFKNIQYKKSIIEAIKSIKLQNNDLILITGSLYLVGEVLNLN